MFPFNAFVNPNVGLEVNWCVCVSVHASMCVRVHTHTDLYGTVSLSHFLFFHDLSLSLIQVLFSSRLA